MKNKEDGDIIFAIKAGGVEASQALKKLYSRNYPKVLSLVVTKGGEEMDAKDVFQESMISFYQMLIEGKFRSEASPDTLIYVIARNFWYQKLRNSKTIESLGVHSETNHIELELDWDEISKEKLVRNLISELGESCQRLILLFYFKKKSMEHIKEEFELGSVQAAKNKKYRCMQELQGLFKKNRITKDILS